MKRLRIILQSNTTYVILCLLIIAYVLIQTKIIKYESKLTNETNLFGIITELNISADKINFVLKTNEKVICNYYISGDKQLDNLLGKKVIVYGKLKDANNNTIPNTFNYKKYLYNNKIYKTFDVGKIEIIEEENIFYKLKNKIINRVDDNKEIIKTYLNLFILGENAYLDDEMYEIYRNNGIWHLFSISGTHISLIILVLTKLFQRLKIKNIIIYGTLTYFMFLTNFSASILRATIFYFTKSISDKFQINISNIKILLLTAFIILLINPFMIYNAGFQYSFLISYSLIKLSKNITGTYFIKLFKISFISFLVSLPITVNMNYEINLFSIVLNLIYVPFISFIIFPISVISFFIPFISSILIYLIYFLEFTNKIFNNFNIVIIIPRINFLVIFIYYFLLIIYFKRNSKKYLILIITLILFVKILGKLDNNYYVYFFDVEQGDSSVMISPNQENVIMIDTGGSMFSKYHVSNNIIAYLKSIGISKIDFLILTHGDYDHMGEAITIVENFKVKKVIFNCGEFNDLERELIKVLDKKKISYSSCVKDLNIDNSKLYFLNNLDYGNENDNSSVIYTGLYNYKFLFMGDAGVEVEQDIINKYNLQDIDVLKIGHHGSKTSSSKTFINKINPKYSIISVGKNNLYNHPNKEVLNNLEDSKIYRTDKQGSITYKINNSKLKVDLYAP